LKPTSHLEVVLSPHEFAPLAQRDLSQATCVVFDVLRATTSMITALAQGATAIIPVTEISEALAWKAERPDILLAGERDGLRIRAAQTGSIDFDLGNSPREFTAETVRGRMLVMTTTNGTRALRACAAAGTALVSSFLNLTATIDWIRRAPARHLVVVCAGTYEEPALEDILAAGALCESLWPDFSSGMISDGAALARQIHLALGADPVGAMALGRNGRRLLAHPDLRADVAVCGRRDSVSLVAALDRTGAVRRLDSIA
jgi:2-phosphosulfolactate phosphatase